MSLSINFKNSLLLIGEKIIVLGTAFFTSVLLARVAGPEIFGQFSYITSFVALFIPLTVMGLNNIATKYFVKYPKHSHHYFLTALMIRLIGAISCIIIGCTSAYAVDVTSEQLNYIFILLILQSFTLFYLVEFYFLAKKQVLNTLIIRLTIIILIAALKTAVILNGANLLYLIILHGLEVSLIGGSYLLLYLKYKGQQQNQLGKNINKTSLLGLFNKGKWLLFSGISAVVYLKIDQVMLEIFHGAEQVAFYAAASKLSEFWYVFPVLISNAYNPKLIELKKSNNNEYKQFLLKALSFMIVASIVICITIYSIATPLVDFIYGKEYQLSAEILSIHIFGTFFIFQRAILSKWLIIENNYRFSLLSTGLGAAVNIILNLMLIPSYGGLGAAWATLISYFVASFLSLALTKQTRKFMVLMIKAMINWPKYIRG